MEFKHTFNVFIDNFSTVYKVLVYRLIVIAVTVALSCAVVIPTMNNLLSSAQYEQLKQAFNELWANIVALNTENLSEEMQSVRDALASFGRMLKDKSWLMALNVCCLAVVYFVNRFLTGIGDYVTGALLNDRMVMHANSSFTFTLFKNVKKATLYGIIYAPIAVAYDILCLVIIWAIVYVGLRFVPIALVKIFLVAVLFIVFSAIKFTFKIDWLPALIHGKMNNRQAMAYSLSQRGKKTASVLSTALVFRILIIGINVAALLFTFGAGLLITLPASALVQLAYCFVNYFDRNRLKYFVDEYTVIGPQKEAPLSRKQFFNGDGDN